MPKLFISYSRKDIAFSEKLIKALQEIQLDSWIDWKDIAPTADWWEQIRAGIASSDGFLFLLSPDSIDSEVCKREIDYAVQNGKRLIPLVIRDVDPSQVHPDLTKLNWIFFREQDDFVTSLKKLEAGIKTDLAWVEFHTRLQVRALEWQKLNDRSLLLRGKDLRDAEEQLSVAEKKDPQPTDFQRQFVLKSRKGESQTRNIVLGIGATIAIVLAVLSVFALNQSTRAQNNASTAVANQNVANTSEAVAIGAANAQATAQANEEIQKNLAQEQADLAQQQSNIAIARQLAIEAKSESENSEDRETRTIALLQAIQSMKLYPSADAFNIIQNYPFKDAVLSSVQDGFVTAARFSPDGKYIVIVGCNIPNYCETNLPNKEIDGFLRMIQTKSGKQTLHMTYSGAITSIAISPDSKHILLGGDDGNARVLDAASGKEISRKTHVATVTTVAFSPDGKYAASSGYDGNIHIWNSTSGAEIFHIIYDEPSLHNIVNTIAFSPDGKYIASGGDNGLRVWDIRTVEEIAYMEHDYGIISLAYSPDGKHIITGSVDNNARIWEVATASLVDQLIHSGDSSSGFSEIKSVAFSPDGKFVATASSDNTARVWIPNGGGYEVSRMTHGSTVNSVDFSPNGRFVVSSSWDGTVRVWETVTGRDVARMAYRGLASTAIFSPDGKYVISSGCDQLQEFTCAAGDDVRVWETDPGDELPSIYQEDGVYGLFLDTDSNHLVAENGNSARIWDLQTQKETFRISYESYLHALAYNSTKNYVATAGDDKNIEIWDASKGDSVTKLQSEFAFPMVFSPDGKYLATGSYGEPVAIHILDSTSWKEASQISPAQFGGIAPFLFSQDGKYLIAGGCDTSVDRNCNQRTAVGVWELSTGRQIARIQHERPVRSIAISPDGEYIISGGCDEVDFNQNSICIHGSAFIWKTATGEKDFQINYAGDVTAGSFSPDGKYVASGGCEQYESFYCIAGSIHIWDISARKEIAEISQDAAITSVAFSPDSKYIALGGEARTIQIFDLTTGNEIARATHKDVVTAIIFSLNGTYVITSSGDGTIRAWIWKPNDIIDYACSRVPRNLTSAEWSEHISDTMPYAKICPNVP